MINQYTKEDQLPETPAQALENFQAQANSLANVVPEVAIALNQAGEAMGILYDQAQTAGNTGAMALISASWAKTEEIANQVVKMDAIQEAAVTTIKMINQARLEMVEQMNILEEAIWDIDETHPMLKDFSESIRHDHEALMMEEAEELADEWATEVVYDSLMTNIQIVTGCNWEQANRLIGVLQGDYAISDLNAALLKELIEHLGD